MTNKYENNIIDAIETIVDNAVANAGYDKTIKATIIECIDQTIGKFKVKKQVALLAIIYLLVLMLKMLKLLTERIYLKD